VPVTTTSLAWVVPADAVCPSAALDMAAASVAADAPRKNLRAATPDLLFDAFMFRPPTPVLTVS
jgi:hypothetical protein